MQLIEPFKLKEVWAIRVWLQLEHRTRELALFDLGLDSKLRSSDLVKIRVRDICGFKSTCASSNAPAIASIELEAALRVS